MNDFQPGDLVLVKRRRKPIFEVLRRVGDSDGWEVKTKDGIVRFFWDNELDAAPTGSKLSAVVDVNTTSSDARKIIIQRQADAVAKDNPKPKSARKKAASASA